MCMHVCECVHMCMYVCVRVSVCNVFLCMCLCTLCIHSQLYVYAHVCGCVHMCACMCVLYVVMCVYMHVLVLMCVFI